MRGDGVRKGKMEMSTAQVILHGDEEAGRATNGSISISFTPWLSV